MIANNIDGTSGSSGTAQVLDLLSLLAGNPKVYENKLKELQDATEKHKEYVDAIGPASEIVRIRTEITEDKREAKDAVNAAKNNAEKLVVDAKASASLIVKEAKDKADVLLSEATAINATAKSDKAELKRAIADAQQSQASAVSAIAATNTKAAELDSAITAANNERLGFEALKTEIISKHQQFIASL